MHNTTDAIGIIKQTTEKYIPGSRILLFGSQARKNAPPDSDYDFLVITPEKIETREKRYLKSLIRKDLARVKIPVDIFIQSEEEVNVKKNITGHILRRIVKEGIVLWTNNVEIKRTHNIEYLLAECAEFDKDFDQIDPKELSDFGVDMRYPGDIYTPDEQEILDYKQIAIDIKRLVENKLSCLL